MSDKLAMAVQLTSNALRFGWYYAVNQLIERETKRQGNYVKYRPQHPVPSRDEIFAELRNLFVDDAAAVADGIYPVMDSEPGALGASLPRLRAMFRDLPEAARRRHNKDTRSVQAAVSQATPHPPLPDYFKQDFHFQTGGYLSPDSARIYDVQVETLFYGAANAMRRTALRPITAHVHGRDQRRTHLLDVGAGTGRLLRQIRLAYPAMQLTGVDLSHAYLDEARSHFSNLRPATWIAANAEHLPQEEASQDIVCCVFLYHELPPEVRHHVAREISRVLRPGGIFVFIDSLQMGDRPGWDGLIETFPARFHEPYYRHYAIDDLDTMFQNAGLLVEDTTLLFLAKRIVCRKPI